VTFNGTWWETEKEKKHAETHPSEQDVFANKMCAEHTPHGEKESLVDRFCVGRRNKRKERARWKRDGEKRERKNGREILDHDGTDAQPRYTRGFVDFSFFFFFFLLTLR
jgi:hypothetical protein